MMMMISAARLCQEEKNATQNRVKLNNTAKESVRWGVSARVGAAIINAALADYGTISKDDTFQEVEKASAKNLSRSMQGS